MYRRYRRYKRWYPRKRYRYYNNDTPPIIYLVRGIVLVLSRITYFLVNDLVSFIRWVWWKIKKTKEFKGQQSYDFVSVEVNKETEPIIESKLIEQKPTVTPRYFKKRSLLSPAEDSFYKVLNEIAKENNYIIQTKVRLEGLIGVHFYTENWFGLRNRIKSREMDFVLCEKRDSSLDAILVIELDDSSHQRDDRRERDRNLDSILQEARLPILHVPASYSYNQIDLLRQIKEKVGVKSDF